MVRVYAIACLCFLGVACVPQYSGKVPPKVVNGEIDLTGWNFEKDGPVKLEGDWLFAWEKFVEPASWDQLQKEMVHTLSVPGYWIASEDPANPSQNLPGTGFASYAVKVQGLSEPAFDLLTPKLREAGSKFLLNLNGGILHIADEGTPALRPADEKPLLDHDLVFSFRKHLSEKNSITKHSFLILIHHSNHHLFNGSIGSPILDEYLKQVKIYNSVQSQKAIMVGVSLIIGIYHLLIFSLRPVDRSIFFFGILCIFVALRQYLSGVFQSSSLSSSIFEYELSRQLAYYSLVLIPLSSVYFLKSLMPSSRLYNKVSDFALLPALILIGFVFFADPIILTPYNDYFLLFIFCCNSAMLLRLISGVINKEREAHWVLLSYFIVFVGVLHDLLSAKGIIHSSYIGPYTLGSFILMQAILISYKNAKIYDVAANLTENMDKEIKLQADKYNQVERLSKEIQDSINIEEFWNAIKMTCRFRYRVKNFVFFLVNEEKSELKIFDLSTAEKVFDKALVSRYKIDLSDPQSIHQKVVHEKKSKLIKELNYGNYETTENYLFKRFKVTALYLLPLAVANNVYAIFSFFDALGEPHSKVESLDESERVEIEHLCRLLSAGFFQLLQKEEVKIAQEEVSRAKNEATINQLAAHLAHEVNNPLNYIATGEAIQNNSFEKFYELVLGAVSGTDEESQKFKAEIDKLKAKFSKGHEQVKEGQERIAKVIAEIRAIAGVDGITFTNFDLVPIINEELVHALYKNQVKIGEQRVKVTGTDDPIWVLSNQHILGRAIRTIITNAIYFARAHRGDTGELYIDCKISEGSLLIDVGNNSFSIKTLNTEELFDLEKGMAYGTEEIGLAMVKELLKKIKCDLVLGDHGRDSGMVTFQLQVPLES